jgi:hypothetical protein
MATAAHRAGLDRSGPDRRSGGPRRTGGSAPHVGLVLVGVLAAGAGAGLLLDVGVCAIQHWRQASSGLRAPGQLLTGLCAGAAGVLLAWLALAAGLTVLALVGGEVGRRAGPLAARIAPTTLRAAVVALLGGSLAVSVGMATSPTTTSSWSSWTGSPGAAHPSGDPTASSLATPGRTPAAGPAPGPDRADAALVTSRPAPGRSPDPAVVVRRGDTLWSIAARHLGPEATAVQVAREWPRWYAANRATIGADPDLLRPGQRLVPPQ